MSDEAQETTETSDKELNFAKLREQLDEANARIADLAPLAVEKAVREAGFAPDTPEGKALSRLAGDTPDAESVKNLAVELGFEAGNSEKKPEPTPNERAASEFANRQSQLNSVTTSDEPLDPNQQLATLDGDIAKAKADGQYDVAQRLNMQRINLMNRMSVAAGPRT